MSELAKKEMDLAIKLSVQRQKQVRVLWTQARADELSSRCLETVRTADGDVYCGSVDVPGAVGQLTWGVCLTFPKEASDAQ